MGILDIDRGPEIQHPQSYSSEQREKGCTNGTLRFYRYITWISLQDQRPHSRPAVQTIILQVQFQDGELKHLVIYPKDDI